MKIAVLAGDGIGPEITREALKVLEACSKRFGFSYEVVEALVGGVAIDKHGDPYPEQTHEVCMNSDAILFGAIGEPKYDNDPSIKIRPEQGLLNMRKRLNLFANIRPVKVSSSLVDRSPLKASRIQNTDFVCIRELTGGIYFGQPRGRAEQGDTAFDTCVYTSEEIKRICSLGFETAMQRQKKLTVVDKANVLATSRLWREIAQQMEDQYPDVETEYMFVDNAAMQMVINPSDFDVIVTENMFGDILTDVSGAITGSIGLLPSASEGTHTSVFEPIHGSFPQAAGKNIANPVATILSLAMLLRYLKHEKAASHIEDAVEMSIEFKKVTKDLSVEFGISTSQVGDWIADYINNN